MSTSHKPTIGVVGGIGSGKSAVARAMAAFGGHLIDADQLGHEALRLREVQRRVRERWGDGIFKPSGEVDRRRLGQIVFANPAELKALESLVFPHIERRIHEEIDAAARLDSIRFVVLDAAILLEAGWHAVCDKVVFVDAPPEVRMERLRQRSGWTPDEVEARERAQMPAHDKRRRADAVIDNTAGPELVGPRVRRLLASWGLV